MSTGLPDLFTLSGTASFVGTIVGCGIGSISYNVSNGVVRPVAGAKAANGYLSWTMIDGTGTLGLVGVTAGSGAGVLTMQRNFANEGYFVGVVTC